MLVGYMRVSSADDRQSVDLQRGALVAAWYGKDKPTFSNALVAVRRRL